jgi:hypothetical protein
MRFIRNLVENRKDWYSRLGLGLGSREYFNWCNGRNEGKWKPPHQHSPIRKNPFPSQSIHTPHAMNHKNQSINQSQQRKSSQFNQQRNAFTMTDDQTFSTSETTGTADRRRRTILIGAILLLICAIVAIVLGFVLTNDW